MKRPAWILPILAATGMVFGVAGCGKGSSAQPQTLEQALSRLRATMANASPDVQTKLYGDVEPGIRYENYVGALMGLDQIAGDPSLNDRQRGLVTNVIELLKAKVQTQPNAPKPGA